MQLEKISAEWVESGNQDLASAVFLMNMRPIPLEIVGFLCRQSVEKYLKVFIVSKNVEPEKTHDLLFLPKACTEFDEEFFTLTDACARLTDYAVKVRYPHPGVLDEAAVKSGLSQATVAVRFIEKKLRDR